MRFNYDFATRLNGQVIRHCYGYPFYMIMPASKGAIFVADSGGLVVSVKWGYSAARRECTRLNRLWVSSRV